MPLAARCSNAKRLELRHLRAQYRMPGSVRVARVLGIADPLLLGAAASRART